ncbi:MAG: hypothetical protein OIF34_11140, partial [Porticoccaceae bacterium]|nr:hypothetical protein [Porticoccaceae bacterium]
MSCKKILTITAADQTGLVRQVADAVADAGGNWLESSMSHLAGKFAGIAIIEIEAQQQEQLKSNLDALKESGLHVFIDNDYREQDSDEQERLLEVE